MLAAGIAHEINNPLGFIKSNFETLISYFKIYDDTFRKIEETIHMNEEIKNYIDIIKKRSKIEFITSDIKELQKDCEEGFSRIINIINALKNFSRQVLDQKNNFSIMEIIEEALTITNNKTKHIAKITKDIEKDVELTCNKTEIVQVLINIIVNAAQALEETNKPEKLISIRVYEDRDDYVVIEISDNGNGMSEDAKKKVFDPFFTTKPVGKGTGLGLYISYDIITNKHNGVIDFVSNYGEGTTFYVKLPKSTKKKLIKVIIVDDEFVADSIANGLRSTDKYIVEISNNGFDAGTLLHTFKPDVVLLDYHMPGITGYDVAKKIKTDNNKKHIKTIVYSGNFENSIIKNLQDIGVDFILEKPFFIDKVNSVIESLFLEK